MTEQEYLDKIAELEAENKALSEVVKYDIQRPYDPVFSYQKVKSEDFKFLNSFENLKCLLDSIDKAFERNTPTENTDYKNYRRKHVITKMLKTLIYNEDYKSETDPDIDGKFIAEVLSEKHHSFAQRDIPTLMRHTKIDNDTYFEFVELFSPYFNTLKKGNPELKNEEVKLLNEVAGTKKKSASKQAKLERGQGLLRAFKNYTPQETVEYHDSFSWYEIIYSHEGRDGYGRYQRYNVEAMKYYHDAGVSIYRDIMKYAVAGKYQYDMLNNLKNGTLLFDKGKVSSAFSVLNSDEVLQYCNEIEANNTFPTWELAIKTMFSEDDPEKNIRKCDGSLFQYMKHILNLANDSDQASIFRLYLNLDMDYIDIKDLERYFLTLECLRLLAKSTNDFSAASNTFIKGLNMYHSYSEAPLSKLCDAIENDTNGIFEEKIIKEAKKNVEKIMKIYHEVLEHPRSREFAISDKYWTDFAHPVTTNNGSNTRTYTIPSFKFHRNSGTPSFLDITVWEHYRDFIDQYLG